MIVAARSQTATIADSNLVGSGARHRAASGTSVAAAHAAGVVALLMQVKSDLTPDLVRTLLRDGASAAPGGAWDGAWDGAWGAGRLRAAPAVQAALALPVSATPTATSAATPTSSATATSTPPPTATAYGHCNVHAIAYGHCNVHAIAYRHCDVHATAYRHCDVKLRSNGVCHTDCSDFRDCDRQSVADRQRDRHSYVDPYPIAVCFHCHAGHRSDHPNDVDTDGICHAIADFDTDGNLRRIGHPYPNHWCLTDPKCHRVSHRHRHPHGHPDSGHRNCDFPPADPRGVCAGTRVRGSRSCVPVSWAISPRKPHASRRTRSRL